MNQGVHDFDQSVFDYFKANNIQNPDMSYNEAKHLSDDWHRQKYENKETKKYVHGIETGEKIGDMYMVPVTEKDEVAEGTNMNNCIGEFCRVGNGTHIYSLRDKNNNPHVSIEVVDNAIEQIKLKNNISLSLENINKNKRLGKYQSYVFEWIKRHDELDIGNLDNMFLSKDNLLEIEDRMKPNEVMMLAAKNGHIDIVKLMIEEYGANKFNDTMVAAASSGHMDIVKLMTGYGANKFRAFNRYYGFCCF